MYKFLSFAGILLAAYFVLQFHNGDLSTNDIFQFMSENAKNAASDQINAAVKRTSASRIEKVIREDISGVFEKDSYKTVSAILPADNNESATDNFFRDLKKIRDVNRFVLIGENHDLDGRFDIALSENAAFQDINGQIIEVLEGNAGYSYGAFKDEYSVENTLPYIERYFPEAITVPIVIKDFADDQDVFKLAEILDEILSDDDFVIGSSNMSLYEEANVSAFHNEVSKNLVHTFDYSALKRADLDSRPVFKAVMAFGEEQGAMEVKENLGIFTFNKGENDVERILSIEAFGDLMPGRYVRVLMDKNGKDWIFMNIAGTENSFFAGADILHANLEGPIKGIGKKGGTSMNFAFHEDIAPFLKKYGFNVLSIANNHATDQGWDGRATTIEALNSEGIGWCGHPSEADSDSVYYGYAGDRKYAFICFHDVTYKLDDEKALELIRSVRPNVDFLIASIHWGYEYRHTADYNSQVSPGRSFIDAGADFVIGHHPHVVQNFEVYNGRLIFYSLGNFVFDQYWSNDTQEQLGIGIILSKNEENFDTSVYLFPMKSESSRPRLMRENELSGWLEKFIGYGEYTEEMKAMMRNRVSEISATM